MSAVPEMLRKGDRVKYNAVAFRVGYVRRSDHLRGTISGPAQSERYIVVRWDSWSKGQAVPVRFLERDQCPP